MSASGLRQRIEALERHILLREVPSHRCRPEIVIPSEEGDEEWLLFRLPSTTAKGPRTHPRRPGPACSPGTKCPWCPVPRPWRSLARPACPADVASGRGAL